jgi:carbamoyltransferase
MTSSTYRVGLSIAHSDRAAVLLKDQVPVKILCEKSSAEEDDPDEALRLLETLLEGQGILKQELKSVSVSAPWRSPELEDERLQQWLLPLKNLGRWIHQDWTFKSDAKEALQAMVGEDIPLNFYAEDQCRSVFALRRYPNQDSLVLNLHSRPGEMGSTLWRVGGGKIRALVAFAQEESLEFLLLNLAEFAGFSGSQGLRNFMALAKMGEESYLDKFYSDLLTMDPSGGLELEMDRLEDRPNPKSAFDDLVKLFGPRRGADSPITVRELDLAASAQALLKEQVKRLSKTLAGERGSKPLVVQSESYLGDLLKGEFEATGVFAEVLWLREKEAVAEALGAIYSSVGEKNHWRFDATEWQAPSYIQLFKNAVAEDARKD